MDLPSYLQSQAARIDDALSEVLPPADEPPHTLHEAMRYSVFAGGKRLRPILVLAAAEACGQKENQESAMLAACAVELMHTYSLVHDDLPAMDDDDLRRGRPTCHKVYGDGIAVLTGDALLTHSFYVLSNVAPTARYSAADFIRELADTGGSRKLIGGQVMDLEGEGRNLTQFELVNIHLAKTAALLTTSMRLGAMCANAGEDEMAALSNFGRFLGLAFQVIDDILDLTQTTEILGKTAGKDESVAKVTYPSILGLEQSRIEARQLSTKARESLQPLGDRAQRLHEITDYLLKREF